MLHGETFFLDEFADRQWDDPEFSGKIEQTLTCISLLTLLTWVRSYRFSQKLERTRLAHAVPGWNLFGACVEIKTEFF
jgi:hypothetical protein